jgi:hypothetical protein
MQIDNKDGFKWKPKRTEKFNVHPEFQLNNGESSGNPGS